MICHPYYAGQVCFAETARKSIGCLLLTCVLLNLPKLFEYRTAFVHSSASEIRRKVNQKLVLLSNNRHNSSLQRQVYQQLIEYTTPHRFEGCLDDDVHLHDEASNFTAPIASSTINRSLEAAPLSHCRAVISLTALGSHAIFRGLYHLGFYLVFVSGLPFILLLYFNFKLVTQVRRARRQAKVMAMGTSERRRTDTTVMLIGVVVVFFTCQVPALLSRVCYVVFDTGKTLEQYVGFFIAIFRDPLFISIFILKIFFKSIYIRSFRFRESVYGLYFNLLYLKYFY